MNLLTNCAVVVTLALALQSCAGNDPTRAAPVSRSTTAAGYNLELGIAYLQKGELALAKDKLERAMAQAPHDANVFSAMATLEDRLGNAAAADKNFSTALRLAPKNPEISNNYAIYLCRNGRTAEGVQRFLAVANNALYQTPEAAYTNAAVCLRGAGKLNEAAANFRKALSLQPNHVEAAYQLADLELSQGNAVAARNVIDTFTNNFVNVTPEMLLVGVRAARASADRVAEVRYARRLRLDFPGSEEARSLSPAAPAPGPAPPTTQNPD